jgi:SAM-dependent methyltransferase
MNDRSAESYGQAGTTWVDQFGVWLSQRAIRRALPAIRKLRILEIGCGYHATQLRALSDRMSHGVGLDYTIAPELLSKAGLSFHQGPVEKSLPGLESGSFDVVLLISVLEHLRDAPGCLESVWRVLRPKGVLLVNVPTWRGQTFLEFSAFRLGLSPATEMDDHKMYYDKRDLWPLLVRAGFPPSSLRLKYHKFGLNLFARAIKPS